MKEKPTFFEFAAEVGLTKHIGGMGATEELATLCGIGPQRYILDVGCGVGITPCFLAKRYGCRVMGVDIMPGMVERSKERVQREGLSHRVEIRQADAQELPFKDETFDTVITESVTVFPPDKQKAVSEYTRVMKPGGMVALNESVWIQYLPPEEIACWAAQELGANIVPLTPESWKELLEKAGLQEIMSNIRRIDLRDESRGLVNRYGCSGTVGIVARMIRLYAVNPAYREFIKQVHRKGVTPAHLEDYFGYGIFTGKKSLTKNS
ncbi:MAG: class I SAM-dependent methyltransferase [Anaerolineaceae bacterium]|nr:class I SAM-dependent methyltransferase [Anaerolineaceae bacterium]